MTTTHTNAQPNRRLELALIELAEAAEAGVAVQLTRALRRAKAAGATHEELMSAVYDD